MSYGYSEDLRERVLNYVDAGHSKTQASQLFNVERQTIYNWLALRQLTGSVKMRRTGKKKAHKIDTQALEQYISQHPDAYLHEIAAVFGVTAPAIGYWCKKLKITRKKKRRFIWSERSKSVKPSEKKFPRLPLPPEFISTSVASTSKSIELMPVQEEESVSSEKSQGKKAVATV
jgi:transposase